MVSEITFTFKMIFRRQLPFDEIHFDLRSHWLNVKAQKSMNFCILFVLKKNIARAGKWGNVNNSVIRNNARLALWTSRAPRG